MNEVKVINVFVSCPRDIKTELDSIKLIFNQINKTSGKDKNYRLEFVNWDLDVYTGIGEDGQDVINSQINGKFDILLAIIWQRIGSPTARYKSGTVEEINRAIEQKLNGENIELMIYFNSSGPENINDINIDQLVEIRSFQNELKEKGVLYKEYDTIEKFESLLRINLYQQISDKLLSPNSIKIKEALVSSPH